MTGSGNGTAAAKQGRIAVVVGPSGAGKDSLMGYAARALSGRNDVTFVRRVITRKDEVGGEDHDSVSPETFSAMTEAGRFAVSWQAHGLSYGIPAETLDAVARGHLVIANGSRSALPHLKAAFPTMTVINITAPLPILAERLEARGRESREEILRRLERSVLSIDGDYDIVTIDNGGTLDAAGSTLMTVLNGWLGR